MRIPERSEHSAEICGDILHDENERHIFFLFRSRKHEITERKKGDESHVVRHDHRTEIRNEYERENYIPHIFEFRYDFPCENFKKSDIRKSFHDKERSEKTTERGKIEIPLIFRVGRNEKHRRNGGNACKA